MAEVAATVIGLGVPIVGEFDLSLLVTRRCKEYEGKSAFLAILALQFDQSERIAIKPQRLLDIHHSDHSVQVFHEAAPVFQRGKFGASHA
jgi:hypothetical protein